MGEGEVGAKCGEHHHYIHAPNAIFFMFFCIVAGGVVRRILKSFPKVPYTVVMFLLGMGMGGAHIWANKTEYEAEQTLEVVHCQAHYYTQFFGTTLANMEPEYLLHIFLPILIFESAFSMDDYVFRKVLVQAVILAGPGLLIASAMTALLPIFFHGWSFLEALLFGAILSATDPVAVVALLKELGAAPEISTVIEGESLLNDGVAIVMYNILKTAVENGTVPPAWQIAVSFVQFTLGGFIMGWLMGRIAVWCLKHSFNDPLIEVSVTVSGAYLTFYLSEGGINSYAHVSGVLALVTFGQILSRRRHAISPEVHHFLHEFWEIAVFWANTLIFVLVGVQSVFNLVGGAVSGVDVGWLFVLYVAVNIIRFIVVAIFFPLLRGSWFSYRLDWKNALLLGWGGLRGGVGLALGLALKNAKTPDGRWTIADGTLREEITFYISGIVLLTLLVNGVTTTNLVQGLQLSRVPDARKQQMRRLVNEIIHEEEKVLRVLQTDSLIADSHWDKVAEMTTRTVTDPYSKPGEKLRVNSKEKARCALLRAFKIQVDHYYEQRLAGGLAVRRLLEIADRMLELPDYFFETNIVTSKKDFNWMEAFDEDNMPGARGCVRMLRGFKPIDNEIVTQFITHAYDMGTCFVNSLNDVAAKIDSFVPHRGLAVQFREKCSNATSQVLKKLQILASHYPDIAMALKTKFASRLILNAGRDAVSHLQHEGIVNNADAGALTAQLERAMVEVNRTSRRMELPDPHTVLKNIPWYSELEREEQVKVKELQQMREAPMDGVLVEQNSNNQPLGIVMSGIVQLRDEMGGTNYLGPGRVINEFSVLTNQPSPYEIVAFTPCKYSTFERTEIMRVLGPTPAVDHIWREYGVHVANNLLSKKLPYVLWDQGRVKTHVEGGTLVKCPDNETMTMWPKYDYLLLRGEGRTTDGRLYTAPAILPTQEDVDVHSTQYKQRVSAAQAAFNKFAPSDGAIGEDQLAQLLSYLGWNFSMSEVHRLMDDADADGSGKIEFDEFVQLLHKTAMNFSGKALIYKIARHKIEKDEEEDDQQDVVELNAIVQMQQKRRSTVVSKNKPYIKGIDEDNELAEPMLAQDDGEV